LRITSRNDDGVRNPFSGIEAGMAVRRVFPLIAISLLLSLGAGLLPWTTPESSGAGETVDHGIYAGLLARYVKNGRVDYAGLKKNDESSLSAYLEILENVRASSLSREEQSAFYINAYNAWTIKLVLSAWPGIRSIKEIGPFWSTPWRREFIPLDGRTMSLDGIEHGIIRPNFRDPRIHFALNCASKSCPPLLNEPYQGRILNAQLDSVTRAFINDRQNNRLEGETLYVSRIFDWYAADFEGGIVSFFLKYGDETLIKALENGGHRISVKYLDYDWSLNSQ